MQGKSKKKKKKILNPAGLLNFQNKYVAAHIADLDIDVIFQSSTFKHLHSSKKTN